MEQSGRKKPSIKRNPWEVFGFYVGKGVRLILIGTLLSAIILLAINLTMVVSDKVLRLQPEPVTIAGTGSMYPTFPKGQGKTQKELSKEVVGTPGMLPYPNGFIWGKKRIFGHDIQRGDIVLFQNKTTENISTKLYGESYGWVKRVIGIGGDSIELRDGIVYRNGEPLKEPYTAKAHSTFGEAYLTDCKKVNVPIGSVFVMGDNRKGSSDSREIGFITLSDISHVLPFHNQIGKLDAKWRNTNEDLSDSTKIHIDAKTYVDLINAKREDLHVKPLKYQQKLETSAQKRGEKILSTDDFSFEATKSGYTMEKAMQDANYSNILYGESITIGRFDTQEFFENQFEFTKSKEFLLNGKYQEIGISEVEGSINGCPTRVVIQHIAGYVPPNYSKDQIQSWKEVLNNIRSVTPSWEGIKKYQLTYTKNQKDIDRLLEILHTRSIRLGQIVSQMEKNMWLTSIEQRWMEEDEALYREAEALSKKLNQLEWQL